VMMRHSGRHTVPPGRRSLSSSHTNAMIYVGVVLMICSCRLPQPKLQQYDRPIAVELVELSKFVVVVVAIIIIIIIIIIIFIPLG